MIEHERVRSNTHKALFVKLAAHSGELAGLANAVLDIPQHLLQILYTIHESAFSVRRVVLQSGGLQT